MFKLYFRVKFYLFVQYVKGIGRYYKNISYAACDLLFHLIYLFQNPYRICRKKLQKSKENIHQYGETPLLTFEKIIQTAKVEANDVFFELGSGRGSLCIWLAFFYPCKIIAVEQIKRFNFFANLLKKLFSLDRLQFKEEDFSQTDLHKASVIYLYGTCMSNQEILRLIKNFSSLRKKTKIITISFPLSDYAKESFLVKKRLSVSFPWGKTTAYIQEKI